jgi:hypothetical protein
MRQRRNCAQSRSTEAVIWGATRGLVNLKLGKLAEAIEDYSQSLQKSPRSVSSLFGRGIATKRTGGNGSIDLDLAQSMDQNIASEFAGYGVTECIRKPTP